MEIYGEALKDRHCFLQTFFHTGKRGRPRKDKRVPGSQLRSGQVIKEREERRGMIGALRRSRFGDISLPQISTVQIDLHNLILHRENRRLTRETIAFSKRVESLENQLFVDPGYYNCVPPHQELKRRIRPYKEGLTKCPRRTSAAAAKLPDHIGGLKEFTSNR